VTALTFRHYADTAIVDAYCPRGDYQGRIAPSGNPGGGFHVLTPAGFRREHVAAFAETIEDAKHAFVAAISGAA
jgi:hypothetical protein